MFIMAYCNSDSFFFVSLEEGEIENRKKREKEQAGKEGKKIPEGIGRKKKCLYDKSVCIIFYLSYWLDTCVHPLLCLLL